MKAAGTYAGYLHIEIMRVVPTYVALGSGVLFLALVIGITRFPPVASARSVRKGDDVGSFRELKMYPQLWLAVVAQFFYVGAQVTTWSAFIPYMKQYTTVTERQAGWFLTGNLMLLLIGRFASTWLMQWIRPVKMVAVYAIANSILMSFAFLRPGFAGAMAVMASSFFMSHHVSYDFRTESKRTRAKYEIGRRHDRYVGRWRSCASTGPWSDCSPERKYCAGLFRRSRGLCSRLRILLHSGTRRKPAER